MRIFIISLMLVLLSSEALAKGYKPRLHRRAGVLALTTPKGVRKANVIEGKAMHGRRCKLFTNKSSSCFK